MNCVKLLLIWKLFKKKIIGNKFKEKYEKKNRQNHNINV